MRAGMAIFLVIVAAYQAQGSTVSIMEMHVPAADVAPHHQADSRIDLQLNLKALETLSKGQILDLALPDGTSVTAKVIHLNEIAERSVTGNDGIRNTVLSLLDGRGSYRIISRGSVPEKIVMTDVQGSIKIYQALLDGHGSGELIRQNPHQYFCIDLPRLERAALSGDIPTPIQLSQTPEIAELQQLQSKPAASNVLFLNYWGGTLSQTIWNEDYNNNEDIIYTPFSHDADATLFSQIDRYLMWLGWREVVEDYAPFDVNITTDIAVYNGASSENRSMIIATTSDAWFGSAGGVANLDSFGNNASGIGWAWNNDGDAFGQTMAHEAGHQMNLSHDGASGTQYYAGHGDWGPIMGAPFGKRYVQWSKGEYLNAYNVEDDLQIIGLKLGADLDLVGDTEAGAMQISSSAYIEGQIQPLGLGGGMDTDVYRFNLSTNENVMIDIAPLLGAEAEDYGSNLSLDAQLTDGVQILAQSVLSSEPMSNILFFDAALAAGSYYLVITALTPDADWLSGFGEYGNGGIYSISMSSSAIESDLSASVTASDREVYIGQLLDFTAWVQNIGNDASGGSVLKFYESTDAVISSADKQLLTRNISSLNSLESDFLEVQLEASDVVGTVYYGVCVDPVISETVIANNCSSAVPVLINGLGLDLDIAEAVELNEFNWQRGGDGSFFRQTLISMNEGDAAQSGVIGDDESSFLQLEITGPGWLSFNWKVSSETDFDYFRFKDSGLELSSISGEQNWALFEHELDASMHSLQWIYDKDPFATGGQDAAWLDQVRFVDRRFSVLSFDAQRVEGDSGTVGFEYTVQSEGGSSSSASVEYSVTGSGVHPANAVDFGGTFPSGTLNFDPGVTEQTLTIYVNGDVVLEQDETFDFSLSQPQGAILGNGISVQSMIEDDELDTDLDGVSDNMDNCLEKANASQINSDGDSMGNACDEDDDNDEVPDAVDNCPVDANPDQEDVCRLCFPIKIADGSISLICL